MKIKKSKVKIGKRFRKDLGDIKSFAKNIKEVGQIVPIVIDKNNNLIDGERRIEALTSNKEDLIEYVRFNPKDKLLAEVSANIGKHFNVIEAVAIWDSLQKPLGGRGKTLSESDEVSRRIKASKLTNYSTDTLSKAKQIINYENKELIEEAKKGNVNGAYRNMQRMKDEEELQNNPPKPIKGKFRTIVIDPPWEYDENIIGRTKPTYALIDMKELEEMNLMKFSDDKTCHLYIWTTNAFIWKAIALGKKWGFEYKTVLTWVKNRIGLGTYFRNSTEHICFFIKKGSKSTRAKDIPTHFTGKSKEHSEKPEEFYKIVERASYPPYLDIFGRKKRKGWYVYGNIKKEVKDGNNKRRS